MSSACHNPDAPLAKSEAEKVLETKIAQYAPFAVGLDLGQMPHNERNALAFMIDAARLMDTLFLEQVWARQPRAVASARGRSIAPGAGRAALLPDQQRTVRSAHDHMQGFAYIANKQVHAQPAEGSPGLDQKRPARPTSRHGLVEARTAQVHLLLRFYPSDATKDEVEKWITGLTGEAHAQATSFFTVIRRGANGHLMAVPYSLEYQNVLAAAASLLRRAAGETAQPTLKRYLELRAGALLSNDNYASDVAAGWARCLNRPPPPSDHVRRRQKGSACSGYKAAFEAFIPVRDDEETKKLETFSHELQRSRGRAADRREVPQPEARRAGADSGRQRRVPAPATAIAAFRRRPSTCRTTTG